MTQCPRCDKRITHGRTACPSCGYKLQSAPVRKIPVVTAIITIIVSAVIIFGAALVVITHLTGENDGDVAFHIDGTWETQSPTYNDEHIVYVFNGDLFSRIVETTIVDASPEIVDSIREYYHEYSGAIVVSQDMGGGDFFLIITMDGTFALDGDMLLLLGGEGMLTRLPFAWEGDTIVINDDRFTRS